jgi:hypothetical protein
MPAWLLFNFVHSSLSESDMINSASLVSAGALSLAFGLGRLFFFSRLSTHPTADKVKARRETLLAPRGPFSDKGTCQLFIVTTKNKTDRIRVVEPMMLEK